jgi:hypothetical protein
MTYYHNGVSLRTAYWSKPGPTRNHDWTAVTTDYEPGHPIGYGPSEILAIINLLEIIS